MSRYIALLKARVEKRYKKASLSTIPVIFSGIERIDVFPGEF
jgi:hypothetical protein